MRPSSRIRLAVASAVVTGILILPTALSAQWIDTRFTGAEPMPRQDPVRPPERAVHPIIRGDGPQQGDRTRTGFVEARSEDTFTSQRADSTSKSSGSPFLRMAISSTIGGGTGMLLGGLAGGAVGRYPLPFLTAAIGTGVGTSLGIAIAGSDDGVNLLEAAFSGLGGFGGGIAVAELLNNRVSGGTVVVGFVVVQGLTAATLGSLFAD